MRQRKKERKKEHLFEIDSCPLTVVEWGWDSFHLTFLLFPRYTSNMNQIISQAIVFALRKAHKYVQEMF